MKHVMLVDDHNAFRESLALMLKWHSDFKESVQAQSLAEARRVLGNSYRNLDLAIVDLDLANGGDFDLIKELRMTHPDIPVLAITLERDVDRRERALRAGVGEVLTMAASLREIVDVAKRLVSE
jgi:DNA-binding NarL/FixJ family response regulator